MRERCCSRCLIKYEHYGQRASICRECKRIYDREFHAKRTKDAKLRKQESQKLRRQSITAWVNDLKKNASCSDCAITDYRVLEFDHVDGHEKEFNVSDMVKAGFSKVKIKSEISKCDVVCANCHRIRTFERRGQVRVLPL